MQRKRKSVALILLCIIVLCSCMNRLPEPADQTETIDDYVDSQSVPYYRHIAAQMDDETGWYYQFIEEVIKSGEIAPHYVFQGFNLRYRYNDAYWSYNYLREQNEDGTYSYYRFKSKSGALRYGEGGEIERNDWKVIDRVFDKSSSGIELIRIANEDRDEYHFEAIDGNVFFDLVSKAMSSPACEPGTSKLYWEKPSYAIKVEPYYIDGYKFQICFVMRAGRIGEVYIDVLYPTGDAYNDYVQLSDLIDEWKADEGQYDAFELIQNIRNRIKSEGSFLAFSDRYKERCVGGIDFARLYAFLNAIHLNEDTSYNNNYENPPRIVEEISKEEFDAESGQ